MSKKLVLVCGPDSADKLQSIIGYDVLFPANSDPGVIELSGPDECWSFIRSIYEGGMVVRVEKHYDWLDDITCFCSEK
jgi:hypothetical protein